MSILFKGNILEPSSTIYGIDKSLKMNKIPVDRCSLLVEDYYFYHSSLHNGISQDVSFIQVNMLLAGSFNLSVY